MFYKNTARSISGSELYVYDGKHARRKSLRRSDAAKRAALYGRPSIVLGIKSWSSTTRAISESPSPLQSMD